MSTLRRSCSRIIEYWRRDCPELTERELDAILLYALKYSAGEIERVLDCDEKELHKLMQSVDKKLGERQLSLPRLRFRQRRFATL